MQKFILTFVLLAILAAGFFLYPRISVHEKSPEDEKALKEASADYAGKKYEAAIDLWKPLADAGIADAQYGLAVAYFNGNGVKADEAKAVEWLKKSADGGNAKAQAWLGIGYFAGNVPTIDVDYAEAAKWLGRAAEQGHVESQGLLAGMYENGQGGLARDHEKALELSKKVWASHQQEAEGGNPDMQTILGEAYLSGQEPFFPKNGEEAFKWLSRAAVQGDPAVIRDLCRMYSKGDGIQQNDEEAYYWYLLSTRERSLPGGDVTLVGAELEKRLTSDQKAAVLRRVAGWKAVPEPQTGSRIRKAMEP